jgi:hypothetical protein
MTQPGHTLAVLLTTVVLQSGDVLAQGTAGAGKPPAPATAAAEVTACAQAQRTADAMLATAYDRLEAGRQSNTPADLRAAVDALQTIIRDVRAQLAACANVGATDPHAGHAMPKKVPEP